MSPGAPNSGNDDRQLALDNLIQANAGAAVSRWHHDGDPSGMQRLAVLLTGLRDIGGHDSRDCVRMVKLVAGALGRDSRSSPGDVCAELTAQGAADCAEVLSQLVERSLATQASKMEELFGRLETSLGRQRAIALAGPAREIVEKMGRGMFADPSEALQALSELQKLDTSEQAQAIGFRVEYFSDPDSEPVTPPPNPIVEGLLYPGLTIIVGPWKRAQKTRFLLGLSQCVQRGASFLGRATRRQSCLWIQCDMGINQFRSYACSLREGHGLEPQKMPVIAEPMDLMDPRCQKQLLLTLDAHKPDLIFIDTARAVATFEENDSDSVSLFVRRFLASEIRDRRGISIVLIVHPAKAGSSARGSGDFEAAADSILRFTPHPDDANKPAEHVKICGQGRHEPVAAAFRIDDLAASGGVGWLVTPVDPEDHVSEPAAPSPEERVLHWLVAHPGQNEQQAVIEGVKINNKQGGDALKRLESRGLAVSATGPRNVKLWSATDPSGSDSERFRNRSEPGTASSVGSSSGSGPPIGAGNRNRNQRPEVADENQEALRSDNEVVAPEGDDNEERIPL